MTEVTIIEAAVAAAVERGKREIIEDVRAGRVPREVATFSELHDHVDANEYGGLCDPDTPEFMWTDDLAFPRAVQDQLNEWIADGGVEEAVAAPRIVVIHLNAEVVGDDPRTEYEIVSAVEAALNTLDPEGTLAERGEGITIHVVLAEEI